MRIPVLILLSLSLLLPAPLALAIDSTFTFAGPEGPAQTAYAPEKGPGPLVILLSGASGPNAYRSFADEVARLGYYTVLLDGNDVLTRRQDGEANLRKAIDRAQRSPQAVPGKAAVIGFSLGGGGALAHAVAMPELVSTVIAYYPSTRFVTDAGLLVKRFQVPVLVLAGGRDTYNNCCLIESMRAMEAAAKELGARFELVVYPDGQHGFNLDGRNYRRDYEAAAWRRTVETLRVQQPIKGP